MREWGTKLVWFWNWRLCKYSWNGATRGNHADSPSHST